MVDALLHTFVECLLGTGVGVSHTGRSEVRGIGF